MHRPLWCVGWTKVQLHDVRAALCWHLKDTCWWSKWIIVLPLCMKHFGGSLTVSPKYVFAGGAANAHAVSATAMQSFIVGDVVSCR